MKIREGFVSNSSSTSFVVVVEDNTEIELRIKVDLAKFGDVLTTEQEVIDYFTEQFDLEDNDFHRKWYEQALDVRLGEV